MAYFNEDNVTGQMCIWVAKLAGYEYVNADILREDKSTVIVDKLLLEALVNEKTNNDHQEMKYEAYTDPVSTKAAEDVKPNGYNS